MKAVRENAAAGGWGFDLCQKICPKYQFKLWFNFGPVLFRILDCVPQVCQHWCQFAVRSVNIFKRPPQDKAAQCDAVSLCQWHRSIALEHGRLNTAGDAGEKWDGNGHGRGGHQCVIHRRVCFHTCNVWVCEVLRCVCHTPPPPTVCRAHFLHRLPPRYFMSESFYSSHLRTDFNV